MLDANIREILMEAIESVKPANIFDNVSWDGENFFVNGDTYYLGDKENIYILGSGKASVEMAKKLMDILDDRVKSGLVISHYDGDLGDNFEVHKASHPLPDISSFEAGRKMIDFISGCKSNDFIIYLLSGVTSSLLEYPADGLDIADIVQVTDLLMKRGADIKELNRVRKKMSLIKGGKLSSAFKCDGIVLVLSDVVGDDLNYIGSAPFYAAAGIGSEIADIFEKYNLEEKIPGRIADILLSSESNVGYKSLNHYILGNNSKALQGAKQKAVQLGFTPFILSSLFQGDAHSVADFFMSVLLYHTRFETDIKKPFCFIGGGETTVEVKGSGKGGRNQEMVLYALTKMQGVSNVGFGCVGTDGIDGNSDAAGAVAVSDMLRNIDMDTLKNFINNNDSYTILNRLGTVIKTGNTGTNVCDVYVGLVS
jgi:hydroxypyruvate reductase/glycerate 2-kinase